MSNGNVFYISYIVLKCVDLPRTLRFYESLGLTFKTEHHGQGPAHHSTQIGGMTLELYPATMHIPMGPARMGIAVADVAAAVQSLEAQGAQQKDTPDGSVCFHDPDGRTIELSS